MNLVIISRETRNRDRLQPVAVEAKRRAELFLGNADDVSDRAFPPDTTHPPDAGLMLGQSLRRWPNIEPALAGRRSSTAFPLQRTRTQVIITLLRSSSCASFASHSGVLEWMNIVPSPYFN